MRTGRVLCVVKGDDTDSVALDTAVDLLAGGQRRLYITYVILVDRQLPLDANMPEEIARAEEVLSEAESYSGLGRDEVQGEILQGRSLGPAIVNESFEKNVGAVVTSVKMKSVLGARTLDRDADYLIANTPCALVLVREPLDGFDQDGASMGLQRMAEFR